MRASRLTVRPDYCSKHLVLSFVHTMTNDQNKHAGHNQKQKNPVLTKTNYACAHCDYIITLRNSDYIIKSSSSLRLDKIHAGYRMLWESTWISLVAWSKQTERRHGHNMPNLPQTSKEICKDPYLTLLFNRTHTIGQQVYPAELLMRRKPPFTPPLALEELTPKLSN